MAGKGGVPVGRDTFRNIASYPTPNWNNPRQISGQHLPNAATFDQVRRFTADVMEKITRGKTISVGYEVALREGLSLLPLVWLNKKAISKHTVDAENPQFIGDENSSRFFLAMITLPRSSAPHSTFCDQYNLDTQNPSSYTPIVKKQCLINSMALSLINKLPSRESVQQAISKANAKKQLHV